MTFQQVNIIPEIPGPLSPAQQAAPVSVPQTEAGAAPIPAPSNEPAAAPSGDRPSWLPEKFKSAEDMAKAYSELEKKQGTPTEAPKAVDFQPYTKEFSEKGDLSPESLSALEAAGVPASMVKQYIDGAKALAEQQINTLTQDIGGREAYSSMVEWATKNLSPEQVAAYNKAVSSNDPAQQSLAIRGLHAQYRESNGPSLLSGKANGSSSSAPFESWAQVKVAMSDKRYASDPAYRNEVSRRLANSKNI